MTNTGRSKMLVILVVVLLLTNLSMLWYYTRDSEKPEEKPELTRSQRHVEWARQELHFTDQQVKDYVALRRLRDSILVPMNLDIRQSKMKMLDYLRQPQNSVSDSTIMKVAKEITDKQTIIEKTFYDHFRRVQGICDPQQMKLLDSMLVKMVYRNTGGANKPGKD